MLPILEALNAWWLRRADARLLRRYPRRDDPGAAGVPVTVSPRPWTGGAQARRGRGPAD
ncbi:hypothetical protein [Deinococcus daejeonensis]|uniref:hypothetical protein n=1 Tax=Deinococcus daejeonensis TaxID=1007098 RepID=UPI001665C556|nr:hypothetical protein [Deinococcus daejeonensis]